MPDWLRTFLRWLIEKSLGGSIPDLPSPREQFLGAIINRLLFPKDFKQVMTGEHYREIITACIFIAIFMWIIEAVFRGVQALRTKEYQYHITQWFYTGAFLCLMTPSIAGVFIGVRTFFDQIGKWFVVLLAGTNDSDEFIRRILTLSDNGFLNVLLTIIQVILLFVLWIWVITIPFALWVSVFFLILGVSFRYVPGFGNVMFRGSLTYTVFAFLGNAVIMIIMAAFIGFGRLFYADDTQAMALTNTAGMLVAAYAVYKLLRLFDKKILASISGIVDTVGSLKGGRGESPGPETANQHQLEREREQTTTRSIQPSTKSAQQTASQEAAESTGDDVVETQTNERQQPRPSSTAQRSQHGLTDTDEYEQPAAQPQTAHVSDEPPSRSEPLTGYNTERQGQAVQTYDPPPREVDRTETVQLEPTQRR